MKYTLFLFFVTFATLGAAQDLDSLKNILSNTTNLNEIAGGANIEEIENKAEDAFKKRCLKYADQQAFDKALAAKDDLTNCITNTVNITELTKEVEEAKPNGNLDAVFKKYCKKSPTLRKCISTFIDTLEPCLSTAERENKKIVMNITESLTDFVCYKDGDRIALFIAESGPECLQEKQEAIQDCTQKTLKSYVPTDTKSLSFDDFPELLFGQEQCDDMVKVEECIVKALEQCDEPTPANIAESLFKFIKKVTPCGDLLKSKKESTKQTPKMEGQKGTGAASSVVVSSSILILSVLISISSV